MAAGSSGDFSWRLGAFQQEWIAFFFFSDGGERAVAGDNESVLRQGTGKVVDGAHDFFGGAAGKIGAADGAGKKCVAGDQFALRRKIKADAAFGVAGSRDHLGFDRAGGQLVAGADAAIDFDFAGRAHTDPGGLCIEHLQQGVVILVEQDGCVGGGAQLHGSADVVDVGVSDDNLLDLEIVLADEGEDVVNVIAGIDDHGFVSGFVADDGAVALQRADGEDFVNHWMIVASHEPRDVRRDCGAPDAASGE